MNVIFTLVFAFPIGFLVKRRSTAILTYLATGAILFSYQSLSVLLDWMANQPPAAFGPSPTGGFPVAYSGSELLGYGVVNLVIFGVGVGLVILGTKLAARRAARKNAVPVA